MPQHWFISYKGPHVAWKCSDGRSGSDLLQEHRGWIQGFVLALTLAGHTVEVHEDTRVREVR